MVLFMLQIKHTVDLFHFLDKKITLLDGDPPLSMLFIPRVSITALAVNYKQMADVALLIWWFVKRLVL
jgi:hypothetical protein